MILRAPPIKRKKIAHAAEQDRSDVVARRREWFDRQLDLDPECLVFIDDAWISTNIARRRGRCRRPERLSVDIPLGHWKTTTFIDVLTLRDPTRRRSLTAPLSSRLRDLCRGSPRPGTAGRRHRRDGQFARAQKPRSAPTDRGAQAPNCSIFPLAVPFYPDPERLRQTQGASSQNGRTNH